MMFFPSLLEQPALLQTPPLRRGLAFYPVHITQSDLAGISQSEKKKKKKKKKVDETDWTGTGEKSIPAHGNGSTISSLSQSQSLFVLRRKRFQAHSILIYISVYLVSSRLISSAINIFPALQWKFRLFSEI
jgi:hypothetical protein